LKILPAEPGVICAYCPITEEADLRMAMEELLNRGWKLFLPRFEDNRLAFRRAESLDRLVMGPFHIPEPLRSAEALEIKTLTIALLPGRAFDRKGGRLGRGNGGYDKWLLRVKEENKDAKIWGIALEMQLTHEVPMEAHDIRMDALVTARGLIECKQS
jgi:5-formyltetrahydrofolate cyclo-ligase